MGLNSIPIPKIMESEDTSDFYVLERLFSHAFTEYWHIFWVGCDYDKYNSLEKELNDAYAIWAHYLPEVPGEHKPTEGPHTYDKYKAIDSIEKERTLKLTVLNELHRAFELIAAGHASSDLISVNEQIDDIHTDKLKYLMLPYLISHVLIEKPEIDKRIFALKRAQIYLNEFMNILLNLGILRQIDADKWTNDSKRSSSENRRTIKIERTIFGRDIKKSISETLDSLPSIDTFMCPTQSSYLGREELYRSTFLNIFKLFSVEALNHLESIESELPFLEAREHNKLVSYAEGATSSRKAKSNAKPWFLHIDSTTKVDPSVAHALYKRMVFIPGHNLPTISLDECARIEMEMDVKTIGCKGKEKSAPISRKESGDSLVDISGSEESSFESDSTAEKAKWDDWKDEHPRGSGNKNRNVG